MRSLVELETDFWRAEALNQLEDVRTSIIAREVIKLHKQKFTGKSLTTRNRSFIQEEEEEMAVEAETKAETQDVRAEVKAEVEENEKAEVKAEKDFDDKVGVEKEESGLSDVPDDE